MQPARVERHALEEGAHDVLAGVVEREVVEAGAQRAVVDRGALAVDPGRVDHAVAAGRHARRHAVEDLEDVGHALLGEQLVVVVQDVVAQERQVAAGGRLQGRQQPAAGHGARHRGEAGEDVGLLERHVGGKPRRGPDVEVGGEVVDRARADGGGGVVDRAGDHLDASPAGPGPAAASALQRAQHVGALARSRAACRGRCRSLARSASCSWIASAWRLSVTQRVRIESQVATKRPVRRRFR